MTFTSVSKRARRVMRYPTLLAVVVVILVDGFALGDETPPAVNSAPAVEPSAVRAAVERGLKFLEADAAKWRQDKQCSTCHHGTMTVWAYSEALSQGYAIAPETVADTIKWTKDRVLERIDLPRDERLGWSMVNTSAMYLSLLARAVPSQTAISVEERQRIADHLLRHQEADGAWKWSSAPPVNRPPPFFESDEVATRLACLALQPLVPTDAETASPVRESRARGLAWLASAEVNDTTQAAALRLLMRVTDGTASEQLAPDIEQFMQRRNDDGGWGQLPDSASDAYATGQALYVLRLADVPRDRPEMQQAAAFLVKNQAENGSWPMLRRGHPGVTPSANTVPIVYFGSAWATLGLLKYSASD